MAGLSEQELVDIEAAWTAYRTPGVSAGSSEDVDPYRCPDCDGKVQRFDRKPGAQYPYREGYTGPGFRCSVHGVVIPRYDERRASRLASLSIQSSSCGCGFDSGPHTAYCEDHDPEVMADRVPDLLAEVRRLRAALAEVMLPIEALTLAGDDAWELAPDVRAELIVARTLGRAALFGAPSRVESAAQRD